MSDTRTVSGHRKIPIEEWSKLWEETISFLSKYQKTLHIQMLQGMLADNKHLFDLITEIEKQSNKEKDNVESGSEEPYVFGGDNDVSLGSPPTDVIAGHDHSQNSTAPSDERESKK